MLELPVTPFHPNLAPPVIFKEPDHLPNLQSLLLALLAA
jgi:hypothetical protein